jgi:hypothetical protein
VAHSHGTEQQVGPQAQGGSPQGQDADSTQIIQAIGSPGAQDPERTQHVSPAWQGQQAPQYHQYQQQPPQQQGQPWHAADDATPPWGGGGDYYQPPQRSSWHGPEAFEDSPSDGKGKKAALAAVGAVVALALVGLGIWLLAAGGSGDDQAASPGTSQQGGGNAAPPPPPPAAKPMEERIPNPPGVPAENNGKLGLDAAQQAGILNPAELSALQQAGVNEITVKSSKEDIFAHEAVVISAPDPGRAQQLKQQLVEISTGAGMQTGAGGALPPEKVTVQQYIKPPESGMYRAYYTSGGDVVRLSTVQRPLQTDDKQLIEKFQKFAPQVAQSVRPE